MNEHQGNALRKSEDKGFLEGVEWRSWLQISQITGRRKKQEDYKVTETKAKVKQLKALSDQAPVSVISRGLRLKFRGREDA